MDKGNLEIVWRASLSCQPSGLLHLYFIVQCQLCDRLFLNVITVTVLVNLYGGTVGLKTSTADYCEIEFFSASQLFVQFIALYVSDLFHRYSYI